MSGVPQDARGPEPSLVENRAQAVVLGLLLRGAAAYGRRRSQ